MSIKTHFAIEFVEDTPTIVDGYLVTKDGAAWFDKSVAYELITQDKINYKHGLKSARYDDILDAFVIITIEKDGSTKYVTSEVYVGREFYINNEYMTLYPIGIGKWPWQRYVAN